MDDPFAALGLPRTFDLTDAQLAQARDRSAADAASYQMITDPRQRAQALLDLMGNPDQDWKGLPTDFESALSAAGNDPQKLSALYQQHLSNISNLFRMLSSNDKGTVQWGRQRMIRSELNALDRIAPLMQQR